VAARLAAQTVALLLVMLITLEVVVYIITRQTLLGSLETTLKARASQADPNVCHAFQLICGRQSGLSGPSGPPGQPQTREPSDFSGNGSFGFRTFRPISGPSEASAAFVDLDLSLVHADGALGRVLLGPTDARKALQTNRAQCCTVHAFKSQDYLVYTAPIQSNGRVVGAVQTSISEHQYLQTLDTLLEALLVVALLGLITSGGISVALVGRALRPIRAAMQRQRAFVADAAHELRTPLAIQRTVGEVVMAEPSPDDLQAAVAQMLGENQHLTKLVEDLSLLARADTNAVSIERRPVDLSSLVAETTHELAYLAEEKGVSLHAEVKDHITTVGDILRLRQLLLILLDNALKHSPAGGALDVRLSPQDDRVSLQVRDSGPGIEPADLPQIFDRFYRSDRARTGQGSGLGLAIGKWIVEAHGGQIRAGNASPYGAVFTVTLPLARTALTA